MQWVLGFQNETWTPLFWCIFVHAKVSLFISFKLKFLLTELYKPQCLILDVLLAHLHPRAHVFVLREYWIQGLFLQSVHGTQTGLSFCFHWWLLNFLLWIFSNLFRFRRNSMTVWLSAFCHSVSSTTPHPVPFCQYFNLNYKNATCLWF